MLPEDVLNIDIGTKMLYSSLRRLVTMGAFLENKEIAPDKIDNELIKDLGEFILDRIKEGESLVMYLDMHGICCSTGSACSSEKLEPSHVLRAMGLKGSLLRGSLRFTLSKYTTEEDIRETVKVLSEAVKKLSGKK